MAPDNISPDTWRQVCLEVQETSGRLSASFTHEVKNQLAVLKEQASLLKDLAAMHHKKPLDPERVDSLGGRMVDRVDQTDALVKRFNAFCHLGDNEFSCVEATETLTLLIKMYHRLANVKEVTLVAENYDGSININTRPLMLMSALFSCLKAMVDAAEPGEELRVSAQSGDSRVRFIFSGRQAARNPEKPSEALLQVLGAELRGHDQGLELLLPHRTAVDRCVA